MPNKKKTQFWIDYNGHSKFAETGPEIVVKHILEELQLKEGFAFQHGTQSLPLTIACLDRRKQTFYLHPDFIVTMPVTERAKKIIEVDGRYHFTDIQEKKRRWRDRLLLDCGFQMIHIDARYPLLQAYRQELKASIRLALSKDSEVEFIDA